MKRQIIGKVYRSNDTPLVNAKILFRRDRTNYTADTIYPPDCIKCRTDSNGELQNCYLWVNEDGDLVTYYSFNICCDTYQISIPPGTEPIQLSVLIAGSNPTEEYPKSLLNYIDEKISSIGGEALKFHFSQVDVIDSYVDINHNFGAIPLIQVVQDSTLVVPDNIIQLNVNVTRLDLASYVPLQNNWTAIVSK